MNGPASAVLGGLVGTGVLSLVLLFVGTASFQVLAVPEVTAFGPSDSARPDTQKGNESRRPSQARVPSIVPSRGRSGISAVSASRSPK